MRADCLPLPVLLLASSGWVNRHRQEVIDYLVEENRVLREQIGNRPLKLTNSQRRRLASKGKRLGRTLLGQVCSIVTPDTILRWYRRLIAAKWTYPGTGTGRPGVMKVIRKLIIRMASENSTWGYCRIQGAPKNLGHRVSPSTIPDVLKEHGIHPAPDRPTTWRSLLRSHWSQIVSTDFFAVEVWTARGLRTYYVLFLLDLATRRVHIAGITRHPNEGFMAQAARGLTRFLDGKRYLICDRDTKYSRRFAELLPHGVQVLRTPFQAPNANAHAERFVRSIKSECLGRLIWFGEGALRRGVFEYLEHYHRERNHQGLDSDLIEVGEATAIGSIRCRKRLGGLLRYYERAA